MTAQGISNSWDRIESWLEANAPRTYASLPPGAEQEAIRAAEAVLGHSFPAELQDSLLRHDGSGYFDVVGVFQFLSVQAIVMNCQAATDLEAEAQQGGDTSGYFLRDGFALWHPSDLPFASDSGGSLLILDTRRQGAASRVGRHDELGHTTFPPSGMWESLNHLLDSVATAMETGKPLGRHTVMVFDGRLQWQHHA